MKNGGWQSCNNEDSRTSGGVGINHLMSGRLKDTLVRVLQELAVSFYYNDSDKYLTF